MKDKTLEEKYRMVTHSIQMLSLRASVENKQDTHERLKRKAKFLEEVRKQSHLCLISEEDRIEGVRYKKLLEYIGGIYDGSEKSLEKILKALDERKDIDEVLKYYDKKNNKSKEEER